MNLLPRHVIDHLAAYDDGRLDPADAHRIAEHLQGCAACRAALEDVRHARQLLEALPDLSMPEAAAGRLSSRLRRPAPKPARRWAQAAAAALLLATAGVVAWRYAAVGGYRPEIVDAAAPIGLEAEARLMHQQLRAGTLPLDLATSEPVAIRRWQAEHAVPDTRLVSLPSRADWPDVRLIGAAQVRAAGARASLVAYEVNGQRATLLSAYERDVPSAPPSWSSAKRVHAHLDATGRPSLSWTSNGQTYSIVSDLPGLGEGACLACHNTPAFKSALDRAVARRAR
jgi:anti-sigma factor RsiW